MAVNTFAAITIGSSEISMKVYEISSKKIIKQIDNVRYPMELGMQTYSGGFIRHETVNSVCDILLDFCKIMKEYGVGDYVAIATSALREASNCLLVIDRIKLITGLKVSVISNSEHRFLCYKAIAYNEDKLLNNEDKSSLIVDIGAGSIQLSIYDEGAIKSTQNIKLGFLRIKELLSNLSSTVIDYKLILKELIGNDLTTYTDHFIAGRTIDNIIVISDNSFELNKLLRDKNTGLVSVKDFNKLYNKLISMPSHQICTVLGISEEYASLTLPVAMIIDKLIESCKVDKLWFPGINVNDGLVVEYALSKMKLTLDHDFVKDSLTAAKEIAVKYKCNLSHNANVEKIALKIFDKLTKLHGLDKRDRMLLQIAIILHNCGEYINMSASLYNSHHIILETEIIGITHREREMIANIIDYNFVEDNSNPDSIRICKLAAILRLANSMDKSHQQKISDVDVIYNGKEISIVFSCDKDIMLEKIFFDIQAKYFAMVYGILPKMINKK